LFYIVKAGFSDSALVAAHRIRNAYVWHLECRYISRTSSPI